MMVRMARPGDGEALARLREALWPEGTWDEHRDDVARILAGRPRSTLPLTLLVAEEEGELVGFVEVGLRSHADGCDPGRPCGYLEGWYVRPEVSGRGVGRALVEGAEAWARAQGCSELASDTWLDRHGSQQAHEALGFEVVDRCVHYRKPLTSAVPVRRDEVGGYGPELARLHHEGFGQVAEAAGLHLVHHLREAGLRAGTVVDLGGGTGRLARIAVDAGYEVVVVDLSEAMLAVAREHVPEARLVHASLWDVELTRGCVAVAAVGEALNYELEGARRSAGALAARLAEIATALTDGGVLLFDVAGPGRSGRSGERHVAHDVGQATILMAETEDRDDLSLTRRIRSFVPTGSVFRRSDERHRLRLYDPEEVRLALSEADLDVRTLDGYGNVTLGPGWHGFLATRRTDSAS